MFFRALKADSTMIQLKERSFIFQPQLTDLFSMRPVKAQDTERVHTFFSLCYFSPEEKWRFL